MTYEITEDQREAHAGSSDIQELGEELMEITSNEMSPKDWEELVTIAKQVKKAAEKILDLNF